jgi:hypothetical protein
VAAFPLRGAPGEMFEKAAKKKTASFGKSLVLNGWAKFISQSGRSLFTKLMMAD